MQKVPAIFKSREEQGKDYHQEFSDSKKRLGICALLLPKSNSQQLYTNVVDDEYGGQEKHTINTFNNTR
jgi:hypothetical protein